MSKKWQLSILGLLLPLIGGIVHAQYGFDFFCRSETLKIVAPGATAYFYFTLINTGSEPDVYQFDCLILQEVPGWSVTYCLRGRCLEPGMPMFDTLNPNEVDSLIDVAVFTNSTEGEEVVQLTVRSLGNPNLWEAITIRTRISGGIEEHQSGLKLPKTALVFDPLGRTVACPLAPGVYFVLTRGGGLKKVVRIK